MFRVCFKQDKHGWICDPFVKRPTSLDAKEDVNLYKIGWGDTKAAALAHCKERNGW